MGESGGKRNRFQRGNDRDGSNQKRRTENKESADGELVVFRLLCPDKHVGSVIGKSGKMINSIRQETHSRIKVVDPFPGSDLRIITIYCYVKDKESMRFDEDGDSEPLCPAHAAVLKVQQTISASKAKDADSDDDSREEAQLLIPASQAAAVIGKSGATIKRLRSKSGANIRINPKDPANPAHSCAMSYDNFLVITGDDDAVTKALFSVSAIMCKFSPREEISLDTSVLEAPPSIIIPSDVPIYPAGGYYPGGEVVVPPSGAMAPVIGATSHMTELPAYGDVLGAWPGYQSTLPAVAGYGGAPKSEDLVIKVVCPGDRIGRVIGRAGSTIKSIRQTTGARIDVDDSKKGKEECLVTVTSTESSDDVKSAAVEAVLMLQGKVNDEDEERVSMRLLVPSKVVGCLIGKGGAIISEIRKTTKAIIHISKGERPKSASSDEELVEVNGEVERVRDALLQIIIRLRDDVLRDREGGKEAAPAEPVYSSSLPVPPVMSSIPPVTSYGYDQRMDSSSGMGMLTGGSLYGYGSYQGGDSGYGTGSLSTYSSTPYGGGGLPPYELVIPASAINKVLGKGGSNLANIRKISGATIDIADSKSSRSERIARISGTQDQMRSAENLIHAFMMST